MIKENWICDFHPANCGAKACIDGCSHRRIWGNPVLSASIANTAEPLPIYQLEQANGSRLDVSRDAFDSTEPERRRTLYMRPVAAKSIADTAGANVALFSLCRKVWDDAMAFDTGEDGMEVDEFEKARDRLIRAAIAVIPASSSPVKPTDFTPEKPTPVTDDMVSRFLGWKLPQDFYPDCHIAFDREKASSHPCFWPSGTNLLHAGQARAMLEHILAATPAPSSDTAGAKRLETTSEHIARDIREGRFPQRSEPQMIAAPPAPSVADADFKNFHRLLCERFGYEHDEQHWKRDQLSLIEHLAWGRCITSPPKEERRSESIDCGECACLPGFCDKEGEVRSVLRMIVEKINAEGPASRDWQGFTHLCELAEQLLAAPSVADAAGASEGEETATAIQIMNSRRFEWITHDHDDRQAREDVRRIIENMSVKSYSAVCRDIDESIKAWVLRENSASRSKCCFCNAWMDGEHENDCPQGKSDTAIAKGVRQ